MLLATDPLIHPVDLWSRLGTTLISQVLLYPESIMALASSLK